MEILVNCSYGGFRLSDRCAEEVTNVARRKYGLDWTERDVKERFGPHEYYNRGARALIEGFRKCVEAGVNPSASEYRGDPISPLRILNIPDGFEYKISEQDGYESVIIGKGLRSLGSDDEDPMCYKYGHQWAYGRNWKTQNPNDLHARMGNKKEYLTDDGRLIPARK